MHRHSIDEALWRLAGRQHGVVSLAQLKAVGHDEFAVYRRVAAGRLHRLYQGVYAVGHMALTEQSRMLAAVVACGPGAALSHRSAGGLWGLVKGKPAIEVTCRRARPPGPGVVVHRSTLARADRGTIDGIPVTSLARTVIDLADGLNDRQLADVVHEAEVRRLFDLNELKRAQERVPGRRGRHRLQRVLANWAPRPFTRSEAERRFLELCACHGLPTPRSATLIAGYEVDFFFADAGVVVEIDGAAVHHTRRAFQEDRRRDRALAAQGLHVVRVTWRDLEPGGGALARELSAILDARNRR